jgi:hypothetical protein
VAWDPERERLAVKVDEGSVQVVGPNVGAMQVVRAGERCVVDLPSRTTRLSSAREDSVPASLVAAAGEASSAVDDIPTPPIAPASAVVPWVKLEERGDYHQAYAAAQDAGVATMLQGSSADDLLRLAQVSRLSGHQDTERLALLACRLRFPGTEPAAIAAYELGRASPPGEASQWYRAYLHELPEGPLAREIAGRLADAGTP